MTSGFYITMFFPVATVIFIIWELAQLQRRRMGNESARTMSQYVVHKIKQGSKGWLWFAVIFVLFYMAVMIWLLWHWELWCFTLGWWC